jgi:hypothetical protein
VLASTDLKYVESRLEFILKPPNIPAPVPATIEGSDVAAILLILLLLAIPVIGLV